MFLHGLLGLAFGVVTKHRFDGSWLRPGADVRSRSLWTAVRRTADEARRPFTPLPLWTLQPIHLM